MEPGCSKTSENSGKEVNRSPDSEQSSSKGSNSSKGEWDDNVEVLDLTNDEGAGDGSNVVDLTNDEETHRKSSRKSTTLEKSVQFIQRAFRYFSTQRDCPPFSLKFLISVAILSCPEKRLSLADIRQYITDMFLYYQKCEVSTNSLRACLMTNHFKLYECRCPASAKSGVCVLSDDDIWKIKGSKMMVTLKEFYRARGLSLTSFLNCRNMSTPAENKTDEQSNNKPVIRKQGPVSAKRPNCLPAASNLKPLLSTGTVKCTSYRSIKTFTSKSLQVVQSKSVKRLKDQSVIRERNSESAKSSNGLPDKTWLDAGIVECTSFDQDNMFSSKSVQPAQSSVERVHDEPVARKRIPASAISPNVLPVENSLKTPSDDETVTVLSSYSQTKRIFSTPLLEPVQCDSAERSNEHSPVEEQYPVSAKSPNCLPVGSNSKTPLDSTPCDKTEMLTSIPFLKILEPKSVHFEVVNSRTFPDSDSSSRTLYDSGDKYHCDRIQHKYTTEKSHPVPTNKPSLRTSDGKIPLCFSLSSQETNREGSANSERPPGLHNGFHQDDPSNIFQQSSSNSFQSLPNNLNRGLDSCSLPGFTTGLPSLTGLGPPNFPPTGQGNVDNRFAIRPSLNCQSSNFSLNYFARPDDQNEIIENFNSKKNTQPGVINKRKQVCSPSFEMSDESCDGHQRRRKREWENCDEGEKNDLVFENNCDFNNKFSEKRDRFDRITHKRCSLNPREDPKERFEGDNYESGAQHREYDELGPDESVALRGINRFNGPPRSRNTTVNFVGPEEFDSLPGSVNQFDRSPGSNTRFYGPPGRFIGHPNWEKGYGERFDGHCDQFHHEHFEEEGANETYFENRYGGVRDYREGDRFRSSDNQQGVEGCGGCSGRSCGGFVEESEDEFTESFDRFGKRGGGWLEERGRFKRSCIIRLPYEDSRFEYSSGRPPLNFGTTWKLTPVDTPTPVCQPRHHLRTVSDSPAEPDAEVHVAVEPVTIPLHDISGCTDSIRDFTCTPWPESRRRLPNSPPPNVTFTTTSCQFPPVPFPLRCQSPVLPTGPAPDTTAAKDRCMSVKTVCTQTRHKKPVDSEGWLDSTSSSCSGSAAKRRLRPRSKQTAEKPTNKVASSRYETNIFAPTSDDFFGFNEVCPRLIETKRKLMLLQQKLQKQMIAKRKRLPENSRTSILPAKSAFLVPLTEPKAVKEASQVDVDNLTGIWRGWEKASSKKVDLMEKLIHKMGLLRELERCDQLDLQVKTEAMRTVSEVRNDQKLTTDNKKSHEDVCKLIQSQLSNLLKGVKYSSEPPFSFTVMIVMALMSTSKRRLSLSEIYQYIEYTFPFYRNSRGQWKTAVHSTLKWNKVFMKKCSSTCQSGTMKDHEGCWRVDPLTASEILSRASRLKQHWSASQARNVLKESNVLKSNFPRKSEESCSALLEISADSKNNQMSDEKLTSSSSAEVNPETNSDGFEICIASEENATSKENGEMVTIVKSLTKQTKLENVDQTPMDVKVSTEDSLKAKQTSYTCSYCGEKLFCNFLFRCHLNLKHLKKEVSACYRCHKAFPSVHILWLHIHKHHQDQENIHSDSALCVTVEL